LPVSDEERTLYALGVNIARQVGGELKPILSPEELNSVIAGFTDSIKGDTEDERSLLAQYGPQINALIQGRQNGAADAEKRKGLQFIHDYLTENPKAINTASGLVYNEKVAGLGKQVFTTFGIHSFAAG
jgi:uncharacterized protein with von Willebrand factor type A (vWA) domain